MDKSSSKVIKSVIELVIFASALSFTISIFQKGEQYNSFLVDRINHKASSRYTLAYEDEHIYVSPADVYYDILAGDISVAIFINGSPLNVTVLDKARNGEEYAINALKTALIHSKYRKEYTYDQTGQLTKINFIGE